MTIPQIPSVIALGLATLLSVSRPLYALESATAYFATETLALTSLGFTKTSIPHGPYIVLRPEDTEGVRSRRVKIAALAFSQQTYGNPDNRTLFTELIAWKNAYGQIAIDMGASYNPQPAFGLMDAGFKMVYRLDNYADRADHATADNSKVRTLRDDVTRSRLKASTADVIVHNQSLHWIGQYAGTSSLAKQFRRNHSDPYWEQWAPVMFQKLAIQRAIQETFRLLRPGGWAFFKLGNYLAKYDERDQEAALVAPMITHAGFREVESITVYSSAWVAGILSDKPIPLVIAARKPTTAA